MRHNLCITSSTRPRWQAGLLITLRLPIEQRGLSRGNTHQNPRYIHESIATGSNIDNQQTSEGLLVTTYCFETGKKQGPKNKTSLMVSVFLSEICFQSDQMVTPGQDYIYI